MFFEMKLSPFRFPATMQETFLLRSWKRSTVAESKHVVNDKFKTILWDG